MWLEIGLLHIFKEEKMFIVHIRGSQRYPRYKVISNGQFHLRHFKKSKNEEKCLHRSKIGGQFKVSDVGDSMSYINHSIN